MPALAMGLAYVGYSVGLYGYCLLRGYNVTLGRLMSPSHPPKWSSIVGAKIPDSQVFPKSAAISNPPGSQTGLGQPGSPPRGPGRAR